MTSRLDRSTSVAEYVDDYVVLGTVAWESPWLTEHNLASELARRHRVLYVEPPVSPLTPFRYGIGAQTRRTLPGMLRRRPRRAGRLHVFTPLALPPLSSPPVRAASAPMVRSQVRAAVSHLGLERTVLLSARSVPDTAGAAGERGRIFLIKDWVEANPALVGGRRSRLAADRMAMCRAVDAVCVTSNAIAAALAEEGIESHVVPHGFHHDLAAEYEAADVPVEYRGLPRPLLGYTGRIDGRLDFDALAALADRFSEGTLVLVGPVSPRLDPRRLTSLSARPNVRVIGERSREDLPAFVAALDCAILPYVDDEWMRFASPLKLWDYLYAGPPIAGTGCRVLKDYPPPLVHFSSPQELPDLVQTALRDPPPARMQRRSFALANTWADRARHIEEIVRSMEETTQRRMAA